MTDTAVLAVSVIRYGIGCATREPVSCCAPEPEAGRAAGTMLHSHGGCPAPLPIQVASMAWWDWLLGLFGLAPARRSTDQTVKRRAKPWRKALLTPNRRTSAERHARRTPISEVQGSPPYRLARIGSRSGHYLCLTDDHDEAALRERQLPLLKTPEDIARWLNLKLTRLAWLVHLFTGGKPETPQKAHYSYRWLAKSKGGWRLIEAPKKTLKLAQRKILGEILEQVPLHFAAHGFRAGHSIVTNAEPHVGQFVVLKWDVENFYPTVGFSRVVAIFRSVGYCREAAIWLARLTTTALPGNAPFPPTEPSAMLPYLRRHLPQGAPTSPALANLSAFRLDLRLSGLARSFGANYTRYADDLTFSGDERFSRNLRTFIPLVRQICRQERFKLHPKKRRILREHQRQTVAGVVVNEYPNISRRSYDDLKAVLTNCQRVGPASQNREQHPNFAAHLQGRIAHVLQLNRRRGEKLQAIYAKIDWKN